MMVRAGRGRAVALTLLLVAVACARSEPAIPPQVASPAPPPAAAEATPPAAPLPPPKSVVATALVPLVHVHADPTSPAPTASLTNPNPDGEPLVFLVKAPGDGWLQVFLPIRPNGATGWVRTSEVTLSEIDWRMKVELGAHRLTVWRGGEVVREEPVAVGMASAPTPTGEYFITELLDTGNPRGPYGPWAFGLSAYSDVHTSFAGGPGQVGLHGTNEPAKLGRDVSQGCVRISNEAITALAAELPVGTPISIVA